MSVKALLDDAAAEATVGLRIDLAAAKRQADEHRARVRWRRTAAMASAAAIAAVVTMIAILLPGGVFRATSSAPATPTEAPIGLPDRVYYSPPWTPPVTRHPMFAASMVLGTYLRAPGQLGLGPVLVSADGRQYASLPWRRYDSAVALSAPGRDVAWATQADDRGNGPERAVVHRIHLSDGRQRDVELPRGEKIYRLLWDRDRLFVMAEKRSSGVVVAYLLAAGRDELSAVAPPPAALEPVQVSLNDGMIDPDPDLLISPLVVRESGGRRTADLIRVAAVSPGDSGPAGKPTLALRVSGGISADKRFPLAGSDPVTDAQVLGWADGGIVVRVHSRVGKYQNRSITLRIFNPETGASRTVTRGGQARAFPLAVATDVVAAGKTVPAAEPRFATHDRAHLRFLADLALDSGRGWWRPSFGVLALVVVLLAIRRRRRRRAAEQASDGPPLDAEPTLVRADETPNRY
jgi:hypothetical protein